MRIVHLSTMGGFYGGEVCLVNLASGLAARGHEIAVITRPHSDLAARLADTGIELLTLPLVGWYEPRDMLRLGAWLRRRQVDILHTHLPRDYYMAALATAGSSVVNVASRHQVRPIRHRLLKRPFLDRFAAMIAVSGAVADGLRKNGLPGRGRIVTIPNGIDPAPVAGPEPGLRASSGTSPDAPVVGAVGRLCPSKGLRVLLRAAARLLPAYPGLRILLVGDGADGGRHRKELEKLAGDLGLARAVRFLGYIPLADRRMGELDVLAVCSRAEPCGLVSLEAMARGVPVVATDSGGSPELVRDGQEGFLVPYGDDEALASRLGQLLENPPLRAALGDRGRQRVRRRFTTGAMLDAVETLYRDLAPRAATAPRPRPAGAATVSPSLRG